MSLEAGNILIFILQMRKLRQWRLNNFTMIIHLGSIRASGQRQGRACVLSRFSHVPLFVPHGLQATRLLCPWDFPGKNTGAGCHTLLQRIFLTQGSNPSLSHLLHWQAGSLPLWPPGEAQFDWKIHPLKWRLFDPAVQIKSLSFHTQFIHLLKKNYLFIRLWRVLVVACKLLALPCGIQFPDQGSNLGPGMGSTES